MKVIHCGNEYNCAVAVKCVNDNYIKLYDDAGVEIASFNGISDFTDFTTSGGSFTDPCDCTMPIPLTAYAIGGRTITTNDWVLDSTTNKYKYEIASNLISENTTTCNVSLLFAENPSLKYEATQEAGKITIFTDAAPLFDVVINSIQIIRT